MWGLVILGSLVQSALALQVFLETPGYSEVNPGATVVLPCFVREKGGECRSLPRKAIPPKPTSERLPLARIMSVLRKSERP